MDIVVVFDLVGVILNDGEKKYADVLAKRNHLKKEVVYHAMEVNSPAIDTGKMSLEKFFVSVCRSVGIPYDKRYCNEYPKYFKLNKGILSFIKKLGKRHEIGLLTNISRDGWNVHNKKYNLAKYFDHVFLSFKLGLAKPDIKIYELLLKKIKNKHCIFVDDRLKNLVAAHKLGIIPIHYIKFSSMVKNLRKHGVKI